MKVWHVKYREFCFNLDAVVVAETGGEAIGLLKLREGMTVSGEPTELGTATGNLQPRVITDDDR